MKKYGTEFGKNIFSTDGLILYCKICDVKELIEKKFYIQQHVRRDKHKNIQLFIHKNSNVKSDFNYDLCNAIVAANISFWITKFLDLFYWNTVIKIFYVNLLYGKITLINVTKRFCQKFVML